MKAVQNRQEKVWKKQRFVSMVQHAIETFCLNNAEIDTFTINDHEATIVFETYHDYDNAAEVYHHIECDLGEVCNHKARLTKETWSIKLFNFDDLGYRLCTRRWDNIEYSEKIYTFLEVSELVKKLTKEEQKKEKPREQRKTYHVEPEGFLNNNLM